MSETMCDERAAGSATGRAPGAGAPARTRHVVNTLAVPFYPIPRPWAARHLLEGPDACHDAYLDALRREALPAARDFSDCAVDACWVGSADACVGGGVAAHASDGRLARLLRDVRAAYGFEGAEVTLEAYPGMVSAETLRVCTLGRVTRVALDFATANRMEWDELGRFLSPSALDVTLTVLRRARVDLELTLACGIPGQTVRTCLQSLDAILASGAAAVDLREFSLEDGCALARTRATRDAAWLVSPRHRLPGPEERSEMRASASERLAREGFSEYLPGFWALPGHECRHRLVRATGGEELGFGLGARTRFDGVGAVNTTDVAIYLAHSAEPARCVERVFALTSPAERA